MSEQVKSGRVRAVKSHVGHVRSGQVRSGLVKVRSSQDLFWSNYASSGQRQVRSGHVMTRSSLVRSSQVSCRSGHVKMCQVMSVRGDVTSGHDRTSQIWSGQGRSCEGISGQVRTSQVGS